jgi:hypothetical protein
MNRDRYNYCHAAVKRCILAKSDGVCGIADIGSCHVYATMHVAEARFHHNVREHLDCEVLRSSLGAVERRLKEWGVILPIGGILDITMVLVPSFIIPDSSENMTVLWHYKDPVKEISWILSTHPLPITTGPCKQCGKIIDRIRCDQYFCSEACNKRYKRGSRNRREPQHRRKAPEVSE